MTYGQPRTCRPVWTCITTSIRNCWCWTPRCRGAGGERVFSIARELLAGGVLVIFVTGLPERVTAFALTREKVRVFKKPAKGEGLLAAAQELLAVKKRTAP